jgi:DNA invertase Pin-like site-specific DNA recombinase
MRLAAYIRVSRDGERPENQEYAIYRWAAEKGHQIIEAVRDVGVSGDLPPAQRPGWQRVMQLLESADGVVVYALDRVARSLWDLAAVVKELEARGKLLLSVREEWLQDVDPRVRQLIISILGWAAEMEREFIRERTREALARLKAQEKPVGRPPKWSGGDPQTPHHRPCEEGPHAEGGVPARWRGVRDCAEVPVART